MARIEPLPFQVYSAEMHAAMSALQPNDSRHQPVHTSGRPKPRNLLGGHGSSSRLGAATSHLTDTFFTRRPSTRGSVNSSS